MPTPTSPTCTTAMRIDGRPAAKAAPLLLLLLALALPAAAPAPAAACSNPLELVLSRGAYDAEFREWILDLSTTLDTVEALLESDGGDPAPGLDALLGQWFAIYTRYASAPPSGWKGSGDWLARLTDVTKALTAVSDAARTKSRDVVHKRVQELHTALGALFREDLPFDPDQLNTDNWRPARDEETAGYDPRAAEDAGLFIGQKVRDLLASIDARTAAVELFLPGTAEAGLADLFAASFRRHFDYKAGESAEASLAVNPAAPLGLMPASEAKAKSGALLLVTCRYAGSTIREREFRPEYAGMRMRRLERTAAARFRVVAETLAGRPEPLFIEEVEGRFKVDALFETGTDEVEAVKSEYRAYGHYPGLDPYAGEAPASHDHAHGDPAPR